MQLHTTAYCLHTKFANELQIRHQLEIKSRIGYEFSVFFGDLLEVHQPGFKRPIRGLIRERA
jgi:hypothetical protein